MQREPKAEQMFLFDLGPPLKYEVRQRFQRCDLNTLVLLTLRNVNTMVNYRTTD